MGSIRTELGAAVKREAASRREVVVPPRLVGASGARAQLVVDAMHEVHVGVIVELERGPDVQIVSALLRAQARQVATYFRLAGCRKREQQKRVEDLGAHERARSIAAPRSPMQLDHVTVADHALGALVLPCVAVGSANSRGFHCAREASVPQLRDAAQRADCATARTGGSCRRACRAARCRRAPPGRPAASPSSLGREIG